MPVSVPILEPLYPQFPQDCSACRRTRRKWKFFVDARRVALGRSASFNVTCRYVRRELRDLTAFDRNAYFDAMHVLYSTEQDLGVKLYGANFKSAAWLVREHLYGAADRECVCALFAPTVCAHDFVWILRAEPSRDHLAPLAAIRDVSVTV